MNLTQLIFPDEDTFRHAIESRRAPWLVTAFLLGLGLVYGVLLAAFQRALGGALAGIPVAEFPAATLYGGNIVAGVLITLAAHVGITIVAWLMARGVGGPGNIGVLYRTTAYLLPLCLVATPYVASYSAAASVDGAIEGLPLQFLYLPLAGLAAALLANGLYALFREVQGVSPARAGVATLGFFLFVIAVVLIA